MKKMILLAMLAVMMASCQKEPVPEVEPKVDVYLTAVGIGTFQVGYFLDHWEKIWVTDTWTATLQAMPGDTVYLSTYTNDYGVTIMINDWGKSVAPDSYYMLEYIVP